MAIYCNPWRVFFFFLLPHAKLSQTRCPVPATFVCPPAASWCNREQDQGAKEFQHVQVSGTFPLCSQTPGPGCRAIKLALSAVPPAWVMPLQGREKQCLLTHLSVSCDLGKAQILGVVQLYSHTALGRGAACPGGGSGSCRARQGWPGAKCAVGNGMILPRWVGRTRGWE